MSKQLFNEIHGLIMAQAQAHGQILDSKQWEAAIRLVLVNISSGWDLNGALGSEPAIVVPSPDSSHKALEVSRHSTDLGSLVPGTEEKDLDLAWRAATSVLGTRTPDNWALSLGQLNAALRIILKERASVKVRLDGRPLLAHEDTHEEAKVAYKIFSLERASFETQWEELKRLLGGLVPQGDFPRWDILPDVQYLLNVDRSDRADLSIRPVMATSSPNMPKSSPSNPSKRSGLLFLEAA